MTTRKVRTGHLSLRSEVSDHYAESLQDSDGEYSRFSPMLNGKIHLAKGADSKTDPPVASMEQQGINKSETLVVVAGATGYIGRAVVYEALHSQGYNHVVALVRRRHQTENLVPNPITRQYLQGAQLVSCDVCDPSDVSTAFQKLVGLRSPGPTSPRFKNVVVVSCLASRSGTPRDAHRIDYEATHNLYTALKHSVQPTNRYRDCTDGNLTLSGHFIMLSAYCVCQPKLQFQFAKLRMEQVLVNDGLATRGNKPIGKVGSSNPITYSIVRPTAFYKSVAGQFENIKKGYPVILFGDGCSAPCNPIYENDLACYMLDCIVDRRKQSKILNIGGSEDPVSHKQYNTMIANALDRVNRGQQLGVSDSRSPAKVSFVHVPVVVFDVFIALFTMLQRIPGLSQDAKASLEDIVEVLRIVQYYATVPMLTTRTDELYIQNIAPGSSSMTLMEYYMQIAQYGQEYDEFISLFSDKPPDNSSIELTSAVETSDAGTQFIRPLTASLTPTIAPCAYASPSLNSTTMDSVPAYAAIGK
jgi:divinyl chlorophyllide a 8-vinyl-reductase